MFDLLSLGLFGVVGVLGYIFFSRSEPDYPAWSLKQQTIVSKTRNKGETAVYRHHKTPFGTPLLTKPEKDVATAFDMVKTGVSRYKNKESLGERINDGPFVYQTYGQIGERIENFGSGLLQLCGLVSKKENMVGIFLKNTPNWLVVDHGCCLYNIVSVPMYDTFDEPALVHIINHTNITTVAVSLANIEKLFSITGSCKVLKYLILVDAEVDAKIEQRAKALKVTVYSMKHVEKVGKEKPKPTVPAEPTELFTICYTSGTTGVPKGVMLTHGAFAASIAAFLARLPADHTITSNDRHLSYLPLSHMFERIVITSMFYCGCTIGFFRGDILKLFDDIAEFKPTVFPSVPRLLSRLYDKIHIGISQASPLKRLIFNIAFAQKKKLLRNGIVSKQTFWDKLVFKNIQARLGGKVRFMITGAAPISTEIIDFLRIAVGCNVLEGYGQTETNATGTLTLWGDYQFPYGSHVGSPFPCCEIKLVDVPSMNYTAEDKPNPRGEICFRGPTIMKGYFKEAAKTAETLDADGWLHTGDVGEILPNGTLKIVDRVKNIFKLSQGEYVAPEKVENKIKSSLILQSFVYGDSLKANLVAVVIPDPETVLPWAKSQNIAATTVKDLVSNQLLKKTLLAQISDIGTSNGLHKFEIPKAIHLDHEPFSVENGLLTPTFKAKRNVIKEKYLKEINEMYKNLD